MECGFAVAPSALDLSSACTSISMTLVSSLEKKILTKDISYFSQVECVREGNSCIEASSTHLLLLYGFVADSEGFLRAA